MKKLKDFSFEIVFREEKFDVDVYLYESRSLQILMSF